MIYMRCVIIKVIHLRQVCRQSLKLNKQIARIIIHERVYECHSLSDDFNLKCFHPCKLTF